MKEIILFTLIASFIYLSMEDCNLGTPKYNDTKFADCRDIIENTGDSRCSGYPRTCLVTSDKANYCRALTDEEYLHIKKYKKYLEEHGNIDVDKIKCGSNYLRNSLVFIAFLTLFF